MIKNKPEVNEDPNVKIIKELKQEIENLRSHIKGIHVCDTDVIKERDQMQTRLQEKELQISELSKAWTDKWRDTQKAIEVVYSYCIAYSYSTVEFAYSTPF